MGVPALELAGLKVLVAVGSSASLIETACAGSMLHFEMAVEWSCWGCYWQGALLDRWPWSMTDS